MNIHEFSTEVLLFMCEGIKKALKEDDALPQMKKKYYIRDHSDFKDTSALFEAELSDRNVNFERIIW